MIDYGGPLPFVSKLKKKRHKKRYGIRGPYGGIDIWADKPKSEISDVYETGKSESVDGSVAVLYVAQYHEERSAASVYGIRIAYGR
jgi:hypothetical protein